MKRGFTLIELLVVISIVALLASIVIASLNDVRERSRITAATQFANSLHHALGDQPGGYWKLDECSGTTALDASGNESSGSLSNSTYVTDTPTGKGCSVSFTGVSGSYVNIPVTTKPDFAAITEPGTTGFTMAAWFKASGLPTSASGYMLFRLGYHEGLYMSTTGTIGGTLWFFDNTSMNVTSPLNFNDGKWHHVAMSVNDSTKRAYLFVDGKEVYAQTYSKVLRSYGTGTYAIGGNGIYSFYGLIDDAMIFGAPLK